MATGFLEKHDGLKWCTCCKNRKQESGFRKVFTKVNRRLVGWKCRDCIAAGKLSVAARDLRAARVKEQNLVASDSRNAQRKEFIEQAHIRKLREG